MADIAPASAAPEAGGEAINADNSTTPNDNPTAAKKPADSDLYSHLRKDVLKLQGERTSLLRQWSDPDYEEDGFGIFDDLDIDHDTNNFDSILPTLPDGKPIEDADLENKDNDFWASVGRYIDTDEARIYTRLLDIRLKLQYETTLLKEWIDNRDAKDKGAKVPKKGGGNDKTEEDEDEEDDEDEDAEDSDENPSDGKKDSIPVAKSSTVRAEKSFTALQAALTAGYTYNPYSFSMVKEGTHNYYGSDMDMNPYLKPRNIIFKSKQDNESESESGKVPEPEPDPEAEVDDQTLKWIKIHRVYCTNVPYTTGHSDHIYVKYYLDEPRMQPKDIQKISRRTSTSRRYFDWSFNEDQVLLKGLRPIENIKTYLTEHENIAFVLYLDYDCVKYSTYANSEFKDERGDWRTDEVPYATPVCEELRLNSDDMKNAAKTLGVLMPDAMAASWLEGDTVTAPYLSFYHYGKEFKDAIEQHLTDKELDCGKLMLEFIEERLSKSFEEARELIASGMISRQHWSKLYTPSEVVVAFEDDGTPRGSIVNSLPAMKVSMFEETKSTVASYNKPAFTQGIPDQVTLGLASWEFDGRFRLSHESIKFDWPFVDDVVKITELDLYPIKYNNTGAKAVLEQRGRNFWMCRRTAYVSYGLTDRRLGSGNVKPRFMIDYDTYRELHPNAPAFNGTSRDDVGEEAMNSDHPPGEGLELLFPVLIDGFSIQDKKWRKLQVQHIEPVEWNTVAFERLVMHEESKELVQALVDVHMSHTRSADMLEGKGNGLLILLHGPPGTGKTLTAESVAELVKRPLYRVTCGDIGTDAEGVEAYLESVLYIGKIWGCVVLLDEADVFLEERSLADLQRNALVSVFLRVLEYYDGILILTSNRVGMFDEAFRSRIKLALHYSALTKPERRKVWRNFFLTLKDAQTQEVDYDDLDDHLDELAEIKLNGREIRNAISTASELALFRKTKLRFSHIQHVIRIGGEFEKYLTKTRGGVSAEEWAIERGVRS